MYIIVLHHYSNIVLHHSANIVLQYFAKLYYTTVLTLYYTTVLTLYYITTVTLYYITALTLYYIIVLRILTSCSSSNICRGWTDNSSWAPPSDHACAQASLQPCQRFRIASDYKCHVCGWGHMAMGHMAMSLRVCITVVAVLSCLGTLMCTCYWLKANLSVCQLAQATPT